MNLAILTNNKGEVISYYDIVVDEDYRAYRVIDYDDKRMVFRVMRIGDNKPFTIGEETVKEMLLDNF
jgi:hypothetical protein